jgi:hypothetical protein
MKIAFKTIEKIKAKGYYFSYMGGTKCFIQKENGGLFAKGRQIFFKTPTDALKYIS